MSGGVDSSVTAAMLHEQGYDVIGVTMQLYTLHPTATLPCSEVSQPILDAKAVADKIGIPHYIVNCEEIFRKEVIEIFVRSYTSGETPIPCAMCNKTVKFGALLDFSKKMGADVLATGHYAQKFIAKDGSVSLHKAVDPIKDQSYFLFNITINQLKSAIFPLGMFNKSDVRKMALNYGLHISKKDESRDICFIQNGDYKEFIKKYIIQYGGILPSEGNIVLRNTINDTSTKIIGKHNGIINYTVGQRKGLGIAYSEALYVLELDAQKNEVVVGPQSFLETRNLWIRDLNWLYNINCKAGKTLECTVKLRSTHTGSRAIVKFLNEQIAEVELLTNPTTITRGQACVLYLGNTVLGGGWITCAPLVAARSNKYHAL